MEKKSYSKTHSALARPAELSILFLLSQDNDRNAYFIKQYMDQVGLHDWAPTSMVTVYKTLKRLLKFGYVDQQMENRGDGDQEVACYNITEDGEAYFYENIKHELETYTQDYFRFDLSIGLSSFMENDERIQLIEKRILQLRQRLKELRKSRKDITSSAFGMWIILDHQINHLKSEISWMKRLIKLIKENIEE